MPPLITPPNKCIIRITLLLITDYTELTQMFRVVKETQVFQHIFIIFILSVAV